MVVVWAVVVGMEVGGGLAKTEASRWNSGFFLAPAFMGTAGGAAAAALIGAGPCCGAGAV